MNILITGSNGFVGSKLMWELEKDGHTVFGIDKSEKCDFKPHSNTVLGDIREKADYIKFDEYKVDFDLIIHCAAEKGDCGISKDDYFSNNEYGTQVLMNYANEKTIKKIIYFSTVSAYGHQDGPCDEGSDLLPNTEYGKSKLAGEKVIEAWKAGDIEKEIVVLRPSVIYGAYNFANMYNLIKMMHKFPFIGIGSGRNIKSMVSINNIVDITRYVITILKPGVQIFNCIDKPYLTVKELMKIIRKHLKVKEPIFTIPDIIATLAAKPFDFLSKYIKTPINSERIRKFITSTDYRAELIREAGFKQQHSIEDELKLMIDWFLKEQTKK